VELITAWDEFTADYPYTVSVDAFCNYYQFRPSLKSKSKKTAFSLARRIGRVAAIQRTCLRLAFKNIPEIEPEWYYFLHSINEEKEVRKTDAISITLLLEPTTGIDILNRMIKAGLLDEEQAVYDKRSRLLRLTPKGEATLKKAEQQVKIVTDLLFSPNLDEVWRHVDDCLAGTEYKLGSLLAEHRPKTLEEVITLTKSPS
ncbi:MAG TPA: winged helix DNA-binding protein, partial [Puia sp.]|nr:winged helix DNA-binding protein [Puia sp.]